MKDGLTTKNLDVTDVNVADDLTVVDNVTLNGDTQIGDAASDTATFYAGVDTSGNPDIDLSGSSGAFKTTTGNNTFNGDVSLASGKTLGSAGGAASFDFSTASGVFKTSTGLTTVGGSTTFSKTATFSGASTFDEDATVSDTKKITFNNVAGGSYAAMVGLDNASKIQGTVTGGTVLNDASQAQSWGVTFESAPNVVVGYKGAVTGGTYCGADNVSTTGGSLIGKNGENVYWIAVGEVQA